MDSIDFFDKLLSYIWIPIVVPILFAIFKFVINDRLLYVKEIKSTKDPNIEEFKGLYNRRIKEKLKICAEEIIDFVGKPQICELEHHLYVCKKINKLVGFVKFMISKTEHYIFIAYIAIDDTDKAANGHALRIMAKKIFTKFFKASQNLAVITEVEKSSSGRRINALCKIIARYAQVNNRNAYILDFDYIQPKMPDEEFSGIPEQQLSLVYIPYYLPADERISKQDLLRMIHSIYYDIYSPSCNCIENCSTEYCTYLRGLVEKYELILPSYISFIKL